MTITETDLQYRAARLLGIAAGWDRTLFRADDQHQDPGAVIGTMTFSAAEFAHPLLSLPDVQALMEALRDAVEAEKAFAEDNHLPTDSDWGSLNRSITGRSWIAEMLAKDVRGALWPLLTGLSTAYACPRCRSLPVELWQSRNACSVHS